MKFLKSSCYNIFLYSKNIPMFECGLDTASRISSSHRIRYSTTSSKPSCTIWWSSLDAFIATPGPPWPSNKAMYKYLIGFIEHLFWEFRYNFLILLLMREVGGISISPIAYCAWSSLYLESYQGKHCHWIAIIYEALNYICRFCTEHAYLYSVTLNYICRFFALNTQWLNYAFILFPQTYIINPTSIFLHW